ncbi:MAG: hypothetical protein HOP12_13615 [Candidatus Eisenbacteria bacterium]|uniref:T9SS type A sorting domain-containing protein n=1 Tax=Eiseniibacteriota bacterium TaxID=2212470 RepID=A0A849T1L8_UNCEI|nr:hypothetical protein [Candidatus Eisenbacteria bacterium]
MRGASSLVTRCLWIGACALAAGVLARVGPAFAADGWQTFAYPGYFTELLTTPTDVWCATREGGLYRFDRAAHVFESFHREPGGIAANELTSLARDRSGRLWVGTTAGVSRRRADASGWDLVNVFDGLPSDSVLSLQAVGDTVWIGTARGLALWNGVEISGSLPDGNTVSFDTTFTNLAITAVLQFGDSLWLGTRSGFGLARLSSGLTDWRRANAGLSIGSENILELETDGTDVFAISSLACHRWRPTGPNWEFRNGSTLTGSGGPGVMMIGTADSVAVFNGFSFVALPNSPRSDPKSADTYQDQLRPAQAADGVVYAASGRQFYESPTAGVWNRYEIGCPPDNNLVNVAVDGDRVYVTTVNGAGRLAGGAWRHYRAGLSCVGPQCDTTFANPQFTFSLLVDRERKKWMGSWTSAFEWLDDTGATPVVGRPFQVTSGGANSPEAPFTWSFSSAADNTGGRWFGLDTPDRDGYDPAGLAYYDANENFVRAYTSAAGGLGGTFIRGLSVDRNNRLWIGYENEGVDFVDLGDGSGLPGGFSALRLSELQGQNVRDVLARGDSLWILTSTRLYRFGIAGPTSATARDTLDVFGGTTDLSVKPLAVGLDGTVWVATGAGLRSFRPDGTARSYTVANSPLGSDLVRSVALDPITGALWITSVGALNRFDPNFIPPAPPSIDRLSVRVWPNPARVTAIGTTLRLGGDGSSYTGAIYDLNGRELRRFSTSANGQVVWDGRDADGRAVMPGVYFLRVLAGGREAVARIVLLR